jgi:hypothetical protein
MTPEPPAWQVASLRELVDRLHVHAKKLRDLECDEYVCFGAWDASDATAGRDGRVSAIHALYCRGGRESV